MICKECKKEFEGGEFSEYDLCEPCGYKLADIFPDDGWECPICGGIIKWIRTKDWEQWFKCERCDRDWYYD